MSCENKNKIVSTKIVSNSIIRCCDRKNQKLSVPVIRIGRVALRPSSAQTVWLSGPAQHQRCGPRPAQHRRCGPKALHSTGGVALRPCTAQAVWPCGAEQHRRCGTQAPYSTGGLQCRGLPCGPTGVLQYVSTPANGSEQYSEQQIELQTVDTNVIADLFTLSSSAESSHM